MQQHRAWVTAKAWQQGKALEPTLNVVVSVNVVVRFSETEIESDVVAVGASVGLVTA
jgi:hypothetical protein